MFLERNNLNIFPVPEARVGDEEESSFLEEDGRAEEIFVHPDNLQNYMLINEGGNSEESSLEEGVDQIELEFLDEEDNEEESEMLDSILEGDGMEVESNDELSNHSESEEDWVEEYEIEGEDEDDEFEDEDEDDEEEKATINAMKIKEKDVWDDQGRYPFKFPLNLTGQIFGNLKDLFSIQYQNQLIKVVLMRSDDPNHEVFAQCKESFSKYDFKQWQNIGPQNRLGNQLQGDPLYQPHFTNVFRLNGLRHLSYRFEDINNAAHRLIHFDNEILPNNAQAQNQQILYNTLL